MAEKIPGGRATDPAADAETWQQLGDAGSWLSYDRPAGTATRIRNKWLELDGWPGAPGSGELAPGARIDQLLKFCAKVGARPREIRAVLERAQRGAAVPGAAARRRHAAERRARLELPRPWRVPDL
jgi:hypothetical protein